MSYLFTGKYCYIRSSFSHRHSYRRKNHASRFFKICLLSLACLAFVANSLLAGEKWEHEKTVQRIRLVEIEKKGNRRLYFPMQHRTRVDIESKIGIEINLDMMGPVCFSRGLKITESLLGAIGDYTLDTFLRREDKSNLKEFRLLEEHVKLLRGQSTSGCTCGNDSNHKCIEIIATAIQDADTISFPLKYDDDNGVASISLRRLAANKKYPRIPKKYFLEIEVNLLLSDRERTTLGHWRLEVRKLSQIQPQMEITSMWIKRFNDPDNFIDTDINQINGLNWTPGVSYNIPWFGRGKFFSYYRPFIGIHASLLNFRKDIDSEFGIGLTGGLFNGVIRGVIGANLHAKGNQVWYYGVGIGLKSVADILGG